MNNNISQTLQQKSQNWNIETMVNAVIADDPEMEQLRESLTQALSEVKRGKYARQTEIAISPIVETRTKVGLSQHKFAEKLGISVNTLRSWEQGLRRPSGAAATLLSLLNKHPELVLDLH
ncbi:MULTISPECIES: helix-turn-helix domain-containing protein [unclassified Lonepinella]|uniref:helix-turn-helix domain-containing protein n=1 Tax=unclassified Lonepinella TaxID=2642006 RepID=UPI0036DDF125